MAFDLQHIDVPFRMQPGLRKLGTESTHLRALVPGTPLFDAKQRVSRDGQALHAAPGFDAGPALDAIWRQANRDGIATPDPSLPLELALEQDLAVLDLASASVPWMCVCVPSGWAPEEKVGRTLADMHAPVADSSALSDRWHHLAALVTAGQAWERQVWTISPSSRFDQHPHRRTPAPWPDTDDPQQFAGLCYLRSEHQTFFPVCEPAGQPLGQAIFTISVALQSLPDAVRSAGDAMRLHQSLASMSDAVLHYKRLGEARSRLLSWLSHRATPTAPESEQNV
jgi:hypothetical protein